MRILSCLMLLAMLAACGGGGGSSAPGPGNPPPNPNPPVGGGEPPETQRRLVTAESAQAFADYLKAALALWAPTDTAGAPPAALLVRPAVARAAEIDERTVEATPSSDAAAAGDGLASGGFTQTNTIVAGVDERDRVKYDGEHAFILGDKVLQVFRMRPDEAGEAIGTHRLGEPFTDYSDAGLYLLDDATAPLLVAVGGGHASFGWGDLMVEPWYYWNDRTAVGIYDIADPAAVRTLDEFSIDGSVTGSRRIGNRLLLITHFTPTVDGLSLNPTSDVERAGNRTLIESLELEDVLPQIHWSDGSQAPLVDAGSCFLPGTLDGVEPVSLPTITTITVMDLRDPGNYESTCMAEAVQGMHVSLDSVYLSGFDWSSGPAAGYYSQTVVHRFDLLEEGARYIGSGRAPGSFWGNPAFMMGEVGDTLAVLTTVEKPDPDDWFEHRLTVFGDAQEFELQTLGVLPGDTGSRIGKPGERIFASRFSGTRAYVVTFEQIDPVYVIDIADPTAPAILGELVIPGFSEYLHPVSDDRVIGIGRDANLDGLWQRFAGVNVRLFDVSDPTDPQMLSDLKIGRRGTRAEVAFDHRAFTFQRGDDVHRLALPVQVHDVDLPVGEDPLPWENMPWALTGLHLYDVTDSALIERGIVVASDQATGRRWANNCCRWGERAFLHGDTIHYLSAQRLVTSDWESPQTTHEAFVRSVFAEPLNGGACTTEARPGLRVGVFDGVTQEPLDCPAVVASDGEYAEDLSANCTTGGIRGVFERQGRYSLTLSAEGYTPRVIADVIVEADECHVETVYVEAYLDRIAP